MKKQRLLPYRQAVPSILLFQIISSLALQIWMSCFSLISRLLIRSTGHVAVTSGDFSFLFTTWQGILLIILAIVNLFLFVAVDLNALVILCNRFLTGKKPSVLYCIKEGFLSLKRFLNPPGILVVLYVSLLSPIICSQIHKLGYLVKSAVLDRSRNSDCRFVFSGRFVYFYFARNPD
nr:hypothetical protein [uncultured Ruminococcus sp.]